MKPACANRVRRWERGQALIEFALMLPVFLLLLLAGSDLLMALSAKQNIAYVAEETAKCWASADPNCASGYQPYARSIASGVGVPNPGTLTASLSDCGAKCASITVSYPAVPLFQGFFPSVTLKSTAQYIAP